MRFPDVVDLCSDEETEAVEVKDVKPDLFSSLIQEKVNYKIANNQKKFEECISKQGFEENRSSTIVNEVLNGSGIGDHGNFSANGFCPASTSPGSSMSICRQFWKAGDYEVQQTRGPTSQNGKNRLRIHPKFLHSNATSHKWAFGAIAELLDNAVDEIQNGATFVIVDKITYPRNGSSALLIQDDGGGMDPESLRRCMSFGFSDKSSDVSIGQYGNGFKTSTMRLGADAIVFSRCTNKRTLTQSAGLLSYTFLRQTCCNDIVVPMVDYEFNPSNGTFERLLRHGEKQFSSNLSTLLKWSPFATEAELLKEFNDIGRHGTKIILFNLWLNDKGDSELDFESDAEDIMICGAPKTVQTKNITKMLNQMHIANRLRYSLRVYSSVLYLHIPEKFRIILCGRVVEPHHIVDDLKYRECIKYKPHICEFSEAMFITTIGFLDGAPNLNIHGFNVYHKNRLILPFWQVISSTYGKGRGVAGVLEANFIKPTHDKQDFEKSALYQKLESRLKEMTSEYWDYHCHLVGYPSKKVLPSTATPTTAPAQRLPRLGQCNVVQQAEVNRGAPAPSHQLAYSGTYSGIPPATVNPGSLTADISRTASIAGASQDPIGTPSHLSAGRVVTALSAPPLSKRGQFFTNHTDWQTVPEKRRRESHIVAMESVKRQAMVGVAAGLGSDHKTQLKHGVGLQRKQEAITMLQENKRLHAQCLEYEKAEKELVLKAEKLRGELKEVQLIYENLLAELRSMDDVKVDKL